MAKENVTFFVSNLNCSRDFKSLWFSCKKKHQTNVDFISYGFLKGKMLYGLGCCNKKNAIGSCFSCVEDIRCFSKSLAFHHHCTKCAKMQLGREGHDPIFLQLGVAMMASPARRKCYLDSAGWLRIFGWQELGRGMCGNWNQFRGKKVRRARKIGRKLEMI